MAEYGRFAEIYDLFMEDVDYKMWSDYLIGIMRKHGLEKEQLRIADCACGTGSLTIELALRGHILTGLDRSADMLALAGQKARARGLSIPFVQQDMCKFRLHNFVDAVTCTCDGVNYLMHMKDVKAFFNAAFSTLRPGGLLLFDISSKYKFENILGNNTFGEDQAEASYIWRNNYDKASRTCEMNLTFFIKKGDLFERLRETHFQRVYEVEKLCELLTQVGFSIYGVYGAFSEAEPAADADRIQIVACKLDLDSQVVTLPA